MSSAYKLSTEGAAEQLDVGLLTFTGEACVYSDNLRGRGRGGSFRGLGLTTGVGRINSV